MLFFQLKIIENNEFYMILCLNMKNGKVLISYYIFVYNT